MQTEPSTTPRKPPQITCRQCGYRHYAVICHICKTPTPHFAVIRPSKVLA